MVSREIVPPERRHSTLARLALTAIDASMLAESTFGESSVSVSAQWADTISRSHRETGQPHLSRVRAARVNALSSIASLRVVGQIPTIERWASRLSESTPGPVVHEGEFERFLREVYCLAVEGNGLTARDLRRLAVEIAAALLEEGRSVESLRHSLMSIVADETYDAVESADAVKGILFQPMNPYIVAIGVRGAQDLTEFDRLAEGRARLLRSATIQSRLSEWGRSGGIAAEYIRASMRASARVKNVAVDDPVMVCVQVRVSARDFSSAAREARKVVARLLDRYTAAFYGANLEIAPSAGVAKLVGPRSEFRVQRFSPPPARSIRADLEPPRSPLRESLRAAAIARRMIDPLTRASFGWIAIETAGFKVSDADRLGKVLALQDLGQRFIIAYRDIQRGVGEISARARGHQSRSERYRRKAAQLGRSHPADPAVRARVGRLRDEATQLSEQHSTDSARFGRLAESAVARINQLGVSKDGAQFGDNAFSDVVDFGRWQFLLRTVATIGDCNLQDGSVSALRELLKDVPLWAGESVLRAAESAESPVSLVSALEDRARFYRGLIDGLYSARNVHLHEGLNDLSGELALSSGGLLVVDTLTELWLYWQRMGTVASPEEIVGIIAARFDDIVRAVDLDLDSVDLRMLTSPDGS